jgi:hypothetical protein
LFATLALLPALAGAQGGHQPTEAGQDAYAAVAEIVAILEADPGTDWSKVRLEEVRQHLIDMNEVVLHSEVTAREVPGGLEIVITGTGRTVQAIHHMIPAHARELDALDDLRASAVTAPDGARLTVTAGQPNDAKVVAKIRGLGFIGLLTVGAHHQEHHLSLARGDGMGGNHH